MPTSSLGQSQLKYLPWSSWNPCESWLLFYLALVRAGQHFIYNECMPQKGTFIESWSYALLSVVGLARLFLSLSLWIWYYFRSLSGNRLEGTIPNAISTLVKLTTLCVLTSFFIHCWLCAPLSHIFKAKLLLFQEFGFESDCFVCRKLNSNQLTGSIPPQISALTSLEPSSVVRFSYVHLFVFAISGLVFPRWMFNNHLTGVLPSRVLEMTELYGPLTLVMTNISTTDLCLHILRF